MNFPHQFLKNLGQAGLGILTFSALFACQNVAAGEVDAGKGTFSVKGGFAGLTSQVSDEVAIMSLKQQHANLFGTHAFYRYRISFIDSKEAVAGQKTYNTIANQGNQLGNQIGSQLGGGNNLPSVTIPSLDYRLQGLDGEVSLGYDLIHKDERNFIGLGILLGISTPWIGSKKSSHSNNNSNNNNNNLPIPDSKTEFWTYKVGPQVVARKSLGHYFSLYGSMAYAYQTAHIKNTKLNVSTDVNGHYIGYDLGFRFQPYAQDFKWGWLTISPRLYANIGVRHNYWALDDVQLDISGQNLPVPKTQLELQTDTTYMGFGYEF